MRQSAKQKRVTGTAARAGHRYPKNNYSHQRFKGKESKVCQRYSFDVKPLSYRSQIYIHMAQFEATMKGGGEEPTATTSTSSPNPNSPQPKPRRLSEPNGILGIPRSSSKTFLPFESEKENGEKLSMEKKIVLVTGGAGFIGSHVADILLGRGDRVIIVDEMNDYYDVRLKQANLEYLYTKYEEIDALAIYRGDICDVDFMGDVFERERPTHICHLAARAGVRPSIVDPYIYVHSNIEGTTRLLDLARQYGCANFVYAR